MKNWNEIKTAFQVARLGTVSAAAERLGVHRATVIRHIDALEHVLGQKIFLRHSRGYTPTEIGLDLMRVAENADEQFNHLVSRTNLLSAELGGNLIVTSTDFNSHEIMPAVKSFQAQYPRVKVQYVASDKVFALEYGEAHVALRAGPRPNEPDYVVQSLYEHKVGLYASSDYIAMNGVPEKIEEFSHHSFIERDSDEAKAPFEVWMRAKVPRSNIVFQSRNIPVLSDAIQSGVGIGFLCQSKARQLPNLIEVFRRRKNWGVPVWLVTHVDQHRTAIVQAFLKTLKTQFAN